MPLHRAGESKSVQLNLRIRPAQRELIARASELRHKNVSEFVIDAATRSAEDALAGQRVFQADEEQYQELLRQPAPWET